jgi:putative acetyltransferase
MRARSMAEMRECRIRPAAIQDVDEVLRIISDVRREFGLLGRVDSLLEPADYLFLEVYRQPRSAYFVAEIGGRIVGGAGISPLIHGDLTTCELQRMYLRPEGRGSGIGQALLDVCLKAARSFGFERCYAETIAEMTSALSFYGRNGFSLLAEPLGCPGHCHNDRWLMLTL